MSLIFRTFFGQGKKIIFEVNFQKKLMDTPLQNNIESTN
jgi:hypothetical protein